MEIGFILFICIGLAGLLYTITGITLYDVLFIKTDKARLQHPHARRWRKRPVIRVADSSIIASVRKSGYRKAQTFSDHTTTDDLWLHLPQNITLVHGALNRAVQQFACTPALPTIALLPSLPSPQTIRQLFYNYRVIMTAPLAAARSGFTLQHDNPLFPILYSYHPVINKRRVTIFRISKAVLQITLLGSFVYSVYFGIYRGQPELLLLFLAGFFAWALWSIGRYPHISFSRKIGYVALLPASLGYFIFRLFTAPLRFR